MPYVDSVSEATKDDRYDPYQATHVKSWLTSHFHAAGKEIPEFEYTPRNVKYIQNLAERSQEKSQTAQILSNDFRLKASEYQLQAARINEILKSIRLGKDSLPPNVVGVAQVLANAANLLDIRDTELSSFLIASSDISLRKSVVEQKRFEVHRESKVLLDSTRKAISRLSYLRRIAAQLEGDVPPGEAQMASWESKLAVMASKERQYMQQLANCKTTLKNVRYKPEISHGILVEMNEHRKEFEKKTRPIQETLRSYQDLPPDKALATLIIQDKKRQLAAAESHFEHVLHSALTTTTTTT